MILPLLLFQFVMAQSSTSSGTPSSPAKTQTAPTPSPNTHFTVADTGDVRDTVPTHLTLISDPQAGLNKVDHFLGRYYEMRSQDKLGPRSPSTEMISKIFKVRQDYCNKKPESCLSITSLLPNICKQVDPLNIDPENDLLTHLFTNAKTPESGQIVWQAIRSCSTIPTTGKLFAFLEMLKFTLSKKWLPLSRTISQEFPIQWRGDFRDTAIGIRMVNHASNLILAQTMTPAGDLTSLYNMIMGWQYTSAEIVKVPPDIRNELISAMARFVYLNGQNKKFTDFIKRVPDLSKDLNIDLKAQIIGAECAYLKFNGQVAACRQLIQNLEKSPGYPANGNLRLLVIKALLDSASGNSKKAEKELRTALLVAPQKVRAVIELRINTMLNFVALDSGDLKAAARQLTVTAASPKPSELYWTDAFYPKLANLTFQALSDNLAGVESALTDLQKEHAERLVDTTEVSAMTNFYRLYMLLRQKNIPQAQAHFNSSRAKTVLLTDYSYLVDMMDALYYHNDAAKKGQTIARLKKSLGSSHPYIRNLEFLIAKLKK